MRIIASDIYPIARKILDKIKANVTKTQNLDGNTLYKIDIKDNWIRYTLSYKTMLKIALKNGSLLFLDEKEKLRGYIPTTKVR